MGDDKHYDCGWLEQHEEGGLVRLCDQYALDGSAVSMMSVVYLVCGMSTVTPLVSPCYWYEDVATIPMSYGGVAMHTHRWMSWR